MKLDYITFLVALLMLQACGGKIDFNKPSANKITSHDIPLNPTNLVARKDKSSEINLSWTSGGGTTSGYIISYNNNGSDPTDCINGDTLVTTTATTKQVTSLNPFTQYTFRVCSVNANTTPDISSSITVTEKTYPTCDYTIDPGELNTGNIDGETFTAVADGIDSFTELQNLILASSNINNSDSAGLIAICLSDGVNIINTNALAGRQISLIDNLYMYAETGNSVTLDNQRDDNGQYEHTAIYCASKSLISLSNFTVKAAGASGMNIDVSTNCSIELIERLTIENTAPGVGAAEGIYLYSGANVKKVKNVNISTTDATPLRANATVGNPAQIDSLDGGTFSTSNAYAGIYLTEYATILEIVDTTVITTANGADGIIIRNDSSIHSMTNTSIKRSTVSIGNASAILVSTSGNNYFNTSNISNNIICTMPGGTSWQFLLSNDAVEYTLDTNPWTNAPGPFGAQTFPWGDSNDTNNDGSTDWNVQTQWGGTCP